MDMKALHLRENGHRTGVSVFFIFLHPFRMKDTNKI